MCDTEGITDTLDPGYSHSNSLLHSDTGIA